MSVALRNRCATGCATFAACQALIRSPRLWPALSLKQLLAIRPERTLWVDVAVKGLTGDAEFGTKLTDLGLRLAHGGLGEA